MVISTNKLFDEIKDYVSRKGEPYSNWYIGTAEDACSSLFVEHGVSEKQDCWIYKQCPNNQSAKHITVTLIKMGCDGWAGGWAESANIVYAYLKSKNTNP